MGLHRPILDEDTIVEAGDVHIGSAGEQAQDERGPTCEIVVVVGLRSTAKTGPWLRHGQVSRVALADTGDTLVAFVRRIDRMMNPVPVVVKPQMLLLDVATSTIQVETRQQIVLIYILGRTKSFDQPLDRAVMNSFFKRAPRTKQTHSTPSRSSEALRK